MVTDIAHLMAAICPDVFCEPKARAAVKGRLREALAKGDRLAYLKAAEIAIPREPNLIGLERLNESNPFDLPGQRSPVEQHTLILDHAEEPVEPVYFNLLDELMVREGWIVEKLVDTASATPGSGLSLDLDRKELLGQQECAKLLGFVQSRVRILIHAWQNWREQKPELSASEDATSHGASESELRQRLEIDRRLLVNELNLLKIQANWLRPYLKPQPTAQRPGDPSLVTAFNTAIFEVVLLVTAASELELAVQAGELPKMLLNRKLRPCQPVLIVEMRFRVVPERSAGGAYGYRGRVEITFTSYALNDDEITVFRRETLRSEWGELLGLLERDTAANLDALLNDLDELLAKPQPEPSKAVSSSTDTNPFFALFSLGDLFKPVAQQSSPIPPAEPLRSDTDVEQVLRSFALLEARGLCRDFYDHQKRRRQMPVWDR